MLNSDYSIKVHKIIVRSYVFFFVVNYVKMPGGRLIILRVLHYRNEFVLNSYKNTAVFARVFWHFILKFYSIKSDMFLSHVGSIIGYFNVNINSNITIYLL